MNRTPPPASPATAFVADGPELFARRWRTRDGTSRVIRLTAPPGTYGDIRFRVWSIDAAGEPIRSMGVVTIQGRDVAGVIRALQHHAAAAGLDDGTPDPGRAVSALDVLFASREVEDIID